METAIWGCRHCGDTYEGNHIKGLNDKCPHCGLLQSKPYEEQIQLKQDNANKK